MCTLVQKDNTDEHPHSLHDEDEVNEGQPCSAVVPVDNHYAVGFAGLGIIHRPKKDIPMWLFTKFRENNSDQITDNQLLEQSRVMAKNIDLNVVRLKFSAHDYDTNELICSPVYSRPILNLKSVATNQLAIEYYKPTSSNVRGGEDMMFFTSKISKKNIMVRIYELDENDDEIWSTNVHILPPNVHRQTGIFFDIPPYRDQNITKEVKVYMQLQRPNDGAVSEPREFYYRPDPYSACRKRARLNNSGDSVPSTRGVRNSRNGPGRTESLQDIPVSKSSVWSGTSDIPTCANTASVPNTVNIYSNFHNNTSATHSGNSQHSVLPQQNPIKNYSDYMGQMTLGSELVTHTTTAGANVPQNNTLQDAQGSQLYGLTTHSESQGLLQSKITDPLLSSAGFDVNWQISPTTNSTYNSFSQVDQMNQASQATHTTFDYASVSCQPTNCQVSQPSSRDNHVQIDALGGHIIENYVVIPEAGQSYGNNATPFDANPTSSMSFDANPTNSITLENFEDFNFTLPLSPDPSFANNPCFLNYFTDLERLRKDDLQVLSDGGGGQDEASTSGQSKLNASTRSARYTMADALQAKVLLKDICDMYKTNPYKRKADIRQKLDKLFKLRLTNGDTFLHMALQNNPPSFEAVVKIIDAMNMNHLLNLPNDLHQTILHIACAVELPSIVTLLIEKGCNPMARDAGGNTAIHLAAMYQTCLEPLLEALNRNNVEFDLNAYNQEKQTALHVAVIYSQTFSAVQLLAAGASVAKANFDGRTPLHLAAAYSRVDIVKAILQYDKRDLDAVDGRGWTALQIACNIEVTGDSLAVIRCLLNNGANPTTHKVGTISALVLASHQPQIRAIFQEFNFKAMVPDKESEDEFESADEGDFEEDVTSQLEVLKLS
ncbi:nuclear factor NF-kappa-B p110 subunit-like isoform X2 [Hyposmocoma kahamanoa]|nr:nuclear factor NF-kappa-B p110 subunit-like isoform X2 [Hyposmocoma kahamanoa]